MALPDRPREGASRADEEALPERIPFDGTKRVLQASQPITGYVLRVFNDVDERIDRAKAAGWRPVAKGEATLSDPSCGVPGSVGTEVSKSVGGGTRGVLMKQKEEWYKADQKAKQRRVDEIEESMLPDAEAKGLTKDLSPRQQLDGIKITR